MTEIIHISDYMIMKKILLPVALMAFPAAAIASVPAFNMPLVQTKFTADPAPVVVNDTVYLYTTHDEDNAEGFLMKDWLLYTSTDMVNWQDRGAVASLKDFKWYDGDNGAWAEQVVYRNGKWYMYCPIHGHGIGVLVADSPYGPFKDPIGKPLVWQKEHWDDIDPTVWVDDDGQAYMYWGNPNLYCVKLNEDMVSWSGDIIKLPKIKDYQEGPWFYKRNGKYYMAFASTCCPEGIGYAMSDGPLGPWEYKGHVMDHTPRTRGNHPGIIQYKGKDYCFGLNYDVFRLSDSRHAERRSVSAAEMTYNPDGTIRELPYFLECTLDQVEPLNPYRTVEAETMAWGYGLKTVPKNQWGPEPWNQLVTDIDDGEYILVKGVDFGRGAKSFTASASSHLYGGVVEIRVDSPDGPLAGTLTVGCTKDELTDITVPVSGLSGVRDLYLVFRGNDRQKRNLFNLDSWSFTPLPEPVAMSFPAPRQTEYKIQTPTRLSDYFTEAGPGCASPSAEGFIGRWMLLEPIVRPNRSNVVFTDSYLDRNLDTLYFRDQFVSLPRRGDKVKVGGRKLAWHALDSKLYNVKLYRFAAALKKPVYGVIFQAATVIDCPEEISGVRLSAGSNSASKWWINGKEVLSLSGDRRMVADDAMSAPLTLAKGRNILWGSVINGPGMSDFCVRFVDADGKPVTGFKICNQ